MTTEKSKSKYVFLTISVIAHAALIYFIAYKALDYALPQGQVMSYEMNIGDAKDSTNVDIVKTAPPAPAPAPAKSVIQAPQKVEPKAPAPQVATGTMPVKEKMEEPAPEEQQQSPQETAQDDSLKQQEAETAPAPEAEAEPAPAPAPVADATAPTPADASAANAPGTGDAPQAGVPEGTVQSDTVLVPFASNKPINYPMMARLRKLEGTALVHYSVDADGNVTDVNIVQSAGSPSLDDEVINTIKNWKFKPMGRSGTYERPVQFTLSGDAQSAPSRLRRGN
jgi:protein TonB